MDTAIKHRVNAARSAIREQIPLMRAQFGAVGSQWKADDTRVTFVDYAISERMAAAVGHSFPQDDFLSEESLPQDEDYLLEGKYAWVLDPVDGTNNYALGIPLCGISLGLLKSGEPVYGFIYDYARDELIEGGGDYGLWVNGKRWARESPLWEPRSAVFAAHFPLPTGGAGQWGPLLETYRIRSLGSAALHIAYTALGRIDGVLDQRVAIWDIAAGIALLRAAALEVHWLHAPTPFPVKRFSMRPQRLALYAGTRGFCHAVQNVLGVGA